MHRRLLRVFVAMLGAAPGLVAAQAAGATPDCGRAQGEVETLICADAALLALGRQLDTVYQAARAQASAPLARQLRLAQRGWVRGRNDCWKARGQQTWITASWTVDTVRACVEAQTRLRISELQAVWRLLPPQTVRFACQGQATHEVVVNRFDTDPPTIRLERGDQTRTLWRIGAGGSGLYEGQNVSVVLEGGRLSLHWLDPHLGRTDEWLCTAP